MKKKKRTLEEIQEDGRKRAELKKRTRQSYGAYLGLEHWTNVKKDYYSNNKRECFICGARHDLNLHHLTYQNIWKEKEKDVVPLCKSCHGLYHAIAPQRLGRKKALKICQELKQTYFKQGISRDFQCL